MVKLKDIKKMVALARKSGSLKPKPTDKKEYVGIEIECAIPGTEDEIKHILAYYFTTMGIADKVRMGSDGSVRAKGLKQYYAAEIRIIDTQKDVFTTVSRVCSVLKKLKALVNDTCGLHVHLDMRNYDDKGREKVFNNLYKSQDLLFSLVKKERAKSHYCRKLGKTMTIYPAPHTVWNETYGHHETVFPKKKQKKVTYDVFKEYGMRRSAINLRSLEEHGTIEVRLHHGSVNALEINKWVALLLKIAKLEKLEKQLPPKKQGLKELGL